VHKQKTIRKRKGIGKVFTMRDEILKWLVNERFIQKSSDVKELTYPQLFAKYEACVQQYQATKEHLESVTGDTIM
jgi:hypothetical protein